jgi:hypothetical protein
VVVQGWAELVAWMQERSAAGALDVEALWEQFRALAATSEQPGLPALVERFDAAPAKDRLALAATIAGMLGPVEWPVAWRSARERLVDGLDELLRQALGTPGTLPHVIDLDALDEEQSLSDRFTSGRSKLSMARELLRVPCRRDELKIVATMCAWGSFWCWRALGKALLQLGTRASDEAVVTARRDYAIAFEAYADAARAMNAACGAVVFTGLDLGHHPVA